MVTGKPASSTSFGERSGVMIFNRGATTSGSLAPELLELDEEELLDDELDELLEEELLEEELLELLDELFDELEELEELLVEELLELDVLLLELEELLLDDDDEPSTGFCAGKPTHSMATTATVSPLPIRPLNIWLCSPQNARNK